jgi:hypothetical protein
VFLRLYRSFSKSKKNKAYHEDGIGVGEVDWKPMGRPPEWYRAGNGAPACMAHVAFEPVHFETIQLKRRQQFQGGDQDLFQL